MATSVVKDMKRDKEFKLKRQKDKESQKDRERGKDRRGRLLFHHLFLRTVSFAMIDSES